MFTGIIETTGKITDIWEQGGNKTFEVRSTLAPELRVDQSLAHQGICLTVEALREDTHQVTAVPETLQRTNAGLWKIGDTINLERAMEMNGRLDGHMVQGHVDATGRCLEKNELDGSWTFRFSFPEIYANLMIEKGSVAINGVSLTCYAVGPDDFTVSIIPYTYTHTQFNLMEPGQLVNIEFDLIGKYVQKMLQHA